MGVDDQYLDAEAEAYPDRPLARAPGVLWRTTLRGVLVNVPDVDEPLLCTSPGDQMWALLADPMTPAELADNLAKWFDADAAEILADLEPVIADLIAAGALVRV